MNRDEEEFAKKITGYLDSGAAGMRSGTLYRLQQARARALASLEAPSPVAEPRFTPAFAGGGGPTMGPVDNGGLRRGGWLGLGAVVLAAALMFGYQQWRAYDQTREIEEIDVQILSSDLPIDAYVDQGFRTWLTSDEH